MIVKFQHICISDQEAVEIEVPFSNKNIFFFEKKILIFGENITFWITMRLCWISILRSGRPLKNLNRKLIFDGASDCFSQLLIAIQSTCKKFVLKLPTNKNRTNWTTAKFKNEINKKNKLYKNT